MILPPYRRWYCFRWRSPVVLWRRLHGRYRPIWRMLMMWQRARHGLSDEDAWGLNHHLARVIVLGVQRLRYWEHGYPAEFSEEFGNGHGMEEWDAILGRIQNGFQAWLDEDGWFHENTEAEERFRDAMGLFSKWFGALWD